MKTAHVVLINEQGLVLGVSRRNDHNNFGLPGGKMEPEDNNNPMLTAIREAKEETGLDVSELELVFAIFMNGNMGHTYLAKYEGEISQNEGHAVKWVPFQLLINGGFGKYNQLVYSSLNSMGIELQLDIDEEQLSEELSGYIDGYFDGEVKFGYIRKERLYPSGVYYELFFDESENDYEESFDAPKDFSEGLKIIGGKYGVNVCLTINYSSK